MMLVYPDFGLKMSFEDGVFCSLIVENQNLFYEMVSDLNTQVMGSEGKFVLSEANVPIEIRKHLELITQFVPFSVNRRELLTKLYGSIQKHALSGEMLEKTNAILAALERYIYEVTEDFTGEIVSSETLDITQILKMFDVRFLEDDKGLCEKLLDYVEAIETYKAKKVFVFVDLRNYVDDEKMEKFVATLLLRKVNFLCVEGCERRKLSKEKRWIIDKDLCLI